VSGVIEIPNIRGTASFLPTLVVHPRDLSVLWHVSDQVAVMYVGKLMQAASTGQR
jgi:ABC-type dipeptide/oligopeptide/nickel transport system ATPase component